MADISSIKTSPTGEAYNIKDATARSGVSAINEKIPSNASSSNKLATTDYVDTQISTAITQVLAARY